MRSNINLFCKNCGVNIDSSFGYYYIDYEVFCEKCGDEKQQTLKIPDFNLEDEND